MKLSGHNYDNDVFSSLLDGLKDDVVLKKEAQKKQTPKLDLNFTQTTEDTFRGIMQDELRFIANELLFAAKQANVTVTGDDLRKFAHQSKAEGLRGKGLERAARRYCSDLSRELAPPQGVTRPSAEMLIHQANASTITPAGNADGDMNHGHRGGYMGQSKNPNTIWDSESLHRMAQVPDEHVDKMGDEQIAASKKAKEDFAYDQKSQFWQALQAQMSDPQNLGSGHVTPIHTQASSDFNPNVGKSAMSIFDNDRDFAGLPEKTAGELLKEQAEARAEKKAEAKDEWNKIAATKKADNNANFVFDGSDLPDDSHRTSTHRDAVDRLFEGLANLVEKKDD